VLRIGEVNLASDFIAGLHGGKTIGASIQQTNSSGFSDAAIRPLNRVEL